ncbi:hypothetical protein RSO01_84580 [Reyranella soli]|uniref:Uncharacterized protein n=1 Tax=Reyranella soli TaxID=1230389 RepID=A0A512NQV5_9HYPH|nr:hypothetical protein RSO01_84580 [Reyranella soli]
MNRKILGGARVRNGHAIPSPSALVATDHPWRVRRLARRHDMCLRHAAIVAEAMGIIGREVRP